MRIEVAARNYTVPSGGTVMIQADAVDCGPNDNRWLQFAANQGNIDKQGIFKAPVVKVDTDVQITIKSVHRVGGARLSETVIVTVKKEEEKKETKKAKRLEPRAHGQNGRYSISVQVTDQKDGGVGCKCGIELFDNGLKFDEHGQPVNGILPNGDRNYQKFTDDNGFCSVDLKQFTEKERVIHIRVAGSELDRELMLEGPKLPAIKPTTGNWMAHYRHVKAELEKRRR
ncbi:hypothetical protein KKC56_01360 [Patescibacteria group bacterium]|nr:hypothetical protein [Pseudomonadota bacterium]MBU1684099.1 hypothetical protein [Patescibacteria group bacterium]MBU1987553.1 hypothetical protein [Patescibacteria group bacterium]